MLPQAAQEPLREHLARVKVLYAAETSETMSMELNYLTRSPGNIPMREKSGSGNGYFLLTIYQKILRVVL